MVMNPAGKYQAYPSVNLLDRQWPSNSITTAPIWCSVDLRDGNQALIEPMGPERKRRMFEHLVKLGFKEIEVGFPSASQTDFDFVREIIELGLIPEDLTIQVLTQAREELIKRTFDSIRGAKRSIVHLYNSTSTLQRRVVFKQDKDGVKKIAVDGAKVIKDLARNTPDNETILYQYPPESFTGTELDYAKEVCEAVMDVWEPTPENKVILNLPATVEMASPNIYADQIEWMHKNLKNRESVVLSLHPHNDRGTGVAAAELGLMAGADRIEGTLFGNGERTGNVDIVTLAMNLYTQGVEPKLNFSNINEVRRVAEHCNQLPVHPRHPYAGDLVFTAFSGSHQDAIKKGLAASEKSNQELWEVPYLPIDPEDVGRTYQSVIRVNSQSGKGGVAYIMEVDHGIEMPRRLQIEFSRVIQKHTDGKGTEITSGGIFELFEATYINQTKRAFEFLDYQTVPDPHASEIRNMSATILDKGLRVKINGQGTGPIDSFIDSFTKHSGCEIKLGGYHEHSIGQGADTQAIAFIELEVNDHSPLFGVGIDQNITKASLKAIISAVNRVL